MPGDPNQKNAQEQFLHLHGVYLLAKIQGEWKILSARHYQFIHPDTDHK